MSYDPDTVDVLLAKLHSISKKLSVVEIFTNGSTPMMVLRRSGTKSKKRMVQLPSPQDGQAWWDTKSAQDAIGFIRMLVGADMDTISQVIKVGVALWECNPFGHWAINPLPHDTQGQGVYDATSDAQHPTTLRHLKELARQLPAIAEIRCDRAAESGEHGKQHTRAFMRVMGRDHQEVAALSPTIISAVIRVLLTRIEDGHQRVRQLSTAQAIATDMDVPLHELPFVLHRLNLFAGHCHADTIVLNSYAPKA